MGLASSGGIGEVDRGASGTNASDFRFRKGPFLQKCDRMQPLPSCLKSTFGPTFPNYQKCPESGPKSASFHPGFSARFAPDPKKYTWATLLRVYRAPLGHSGQISSSGRPLADPPDRPLGILGGYPGTGGLRAEKGCRGARKVLRCP